MPLVLQCPACRTLVAVHEVSIPLDGARAGFSCSACGATTWLPASGAADARSSDAHANETPTRARVQPPPALPPATALVSRAPSEPSAPPVHGRGPRLTEEQRALVAEKLKRLAPADAEQERIAGDFLRLLEAWDDPGAHKALLQRASAGGGLAFAGQGYRAVLDAIPGEPVAKRAQNEILGLAMASLASTREIGKVEKAGKSVAPLVMVGVAVVILLVVLVAVLPRLLRPGADGATIGADPGAVPGQE